MKRSFAVALVFCGLALLPILADPLPGVFNTGVDNSGVLLDNAMPDAHYQLISSADTNAPGPQVFTLSPGFPMGPWLDEGPSSRWVAPMADQSVGNAPGDYTFRTSFDLTGFDPFTVDIEGLMSSDNTVKVRLNGVDMTATQAGFGRFGPFNFTAGFVAGLNHLDFIVNNAPPGSNPIGFRAVLVADAVPIAAETPLSIISQPASNVIGRATGTSTLRVVARGSAPVTYQSYKGTNAVTGANTAELTLTNLQFADTASYTVRLTNAVNSVSSEATLVTIKPALETQTIRFARVTIDGSTGRSQRIDYVDKLSTAGSNNWNSFMNFTLAPNPRQIFDQGSANASNRLYRA